MRRNLARYFLVGCTIFNLLHFTRRGVLIVGALLCHKVYAEQVKLPVIEFAVKPNLCVLAESEPSCKDRLQIKWRAKHPVNVCLYQSDKRLPLRCWEEQVSGAHGVDIQISNNVDFVLREVGDDDPIAQKVFQVVQDNVKYRHRRRNAWSFF